jgi:nucleoside-diphosphate-sugar epimerase
LFGRLLLERGAKMAETLFVTGATGFIGSKLIQRLDLSRYDRIYCLSRYPQNDRLAHNVDRKIQFIQGNLFDSSIYDSFLANTTTVIHLAAATGKVGRDDYQRTNADGTKFFVDQCKKAGVNNFLYISTIAVNYADKSKYYYAQSKEKGENAVIHSGLAYLIVRPTIVIGENSSLSKTLFKLASSPVIPVFGGGETLIQPIYIDDLITCLLAILEKNNYSNEILEMGGPEIINFEKFFVRMHELTFQIEPKVLHLPLKPVITILSIIEKPFYSYLPMTVGQLSAFSYNGTIRKNWLYDQYAPRMKNIKEMLMLVIGLNQRVRQQSILDRECKVFTRYLIKEDPSSYILEKYSEAHVVSKIFNDLSISSFDIFLLNTSVRCTILTKLVDAYTSIFKKDSLFRKKMILLLAILENSAPAFLYFERPGKPGITAFVTRLFSQGIVFALNLIFSVVLFTPVKIYFSIRPGPSLVGIKLWTKY